MQIPNYTFKNSGTLINNDVVHPNLFELASYSYRFIIEPKNTKFWRFGLRFSKTKEVEFYHPNNRYKEPDFKKFKDIHLGVGEWDGVKWTLPERIHLAHYNFDSLDHILNYSLPYVENGKVEWTIRYSRLS